jgi:hypothetical protein
MTNNNRYKILMLFTLLLTFLPLLLVAGNTTPERRKVLKKIPAPSTQPSIAPTPKKEIIPAPTVEIREVPVEKIVEKEVVREVTVTPPKTATQTYYHPTPHPTHYPKVVAREDLPLAGAEKFGQAAVLNAIFWSAYYFKRSKQRLKFALKEVIN